MEENFALARYLEVGQLRFRCVYRFVDLLRGLVQALELFPHGADLRLVLLYLLVVLPRRLCAPDSHEQKHVTARRALACSTVCVRVCVLVCWSLSLCVRVVSLM